MDLLFSRYDGVGILDRTGKFHCTPAAKRFTPFGVQILVENNLVEEEKLDKLGEIECSYYSGEIKVSDVIRPDLLVIHFADLLDPRGDDMIQLLCSLMEKWKLARGFGMVYNFPGVGVHVMVAVDGTLYPEEAVALGRLEGLGEPSHATACGSSEFDVDPDLYQLLASMPNGVPPGNGDGVDLVTQRLCAATLGNRIVRSAFRSYIYLRGVIVDVNAGFDIYSAKYSVFLYDKGVFGEFNMNNIAPLPSDCFRMIPPQYRLLKIPGLRPMGINRLTVDLFSGEKTDVAVSCSTWSKIARKTTKKALFEPGRILKLDALGDHGEYLFGDIRFQDSNPTGQVHKQNTGISSESSEKKSYADYMVRKRVAHFDEKSFFDDIMVDAEDDGKGDWRKQAKASN